ncbi:hypothetical protein MRX96_046637 [Rhipicephalus microplus]
MPPAMVGGGHRERRVEHAEALAGAVRHCQPAPPLNAEDGCSKVTWPFASTLTLPHTSCKHYHSSVVASYACWSCDISLPLLSW